MPYASDDPSDPRYVPLNPAQRTEAANYAQNLIRRGGLSDSEIVDMVGTRIPGTDNSDRLPLFTIIRQAHRAVDAAAQISQTPGITPDPSIIPNTPQPTSNVGRYIYDVVITVTDPTTGDQYTTREEMVSTIVMSIDQLRDEVMNNQDRYIRNATSPPPPHGFTAQPNIDVHLLDVGRGI